MEIRILAPLLLMTLQQLIGIQDQLESTDMFEKWFPEDIVSLAQKVNHVPSSVNSETGQTTVYVFPAPFF